GSGGPALQVGRLSRKDRAAVFLVGILTHLTGQLAPRAVARETTGGKTVCAPRRSPSRLHAEEAQGGDGEREIALALALEPGRRQPMERAGNADLLRDRSQRDDPIQMGGLPRQERYRHRAGGAA